MTGGADLLDWNVIGGKPEGAIVGPTCGLHWPNLLHENPDRNSEIVDGWVKLLAPYNNRPGIILAKNPLSFQKQLIHQKLTKVEVVDSTIKLDFSETDKLGTIISNNEFHIKVSSDSELSFDSDIIDIVSVSTIKKDHTILYNLRLRKPNIHRASIYFKDMKI